MSWSREQAEAALARGNELRIARANLRKEVAGMPFLDGLAWVAAALRRHAAGAHWQHATTLKGAYVFDVLAWPHRSGPETARELALKAGCPRVTRIAQLRFRDLTSREASALAGAIDRRLQAAGGERDA